MLVVTLVLAWLLLLTAGYGLWLTRVLLKADDELVAADVRLRVVERQLAGAAAGERDVNRRLVRATAQLDRMVDVAETNGGTRA